MKKLCIFLLVIAIGIEGSAQNPYSNEAVIPTSPIAASLGLYNDIPVSYNTGVPDISIPLYTIQVGDFSLPIVLRYHLRSLKPANCETNVALGWTLHFGGFVTRTIYGKPDEDSDHSTYKSGNGNGNNVDLKYLYEKENSRQDPEMDIFSYNVTGASGEFIVLDTYSPLQINKNPVDIKVNSLLVNIESEDDIIITNENGVKFEFGFGSLETAYPEYESESVTAWILRKIDLPSNQSIVFESTDFTTFFKTSGSSHVFVRDEHFGMAASLGGGNDLLTFMCGPPVISPDNVYNNRLVLEKNIRSIRFPNGLIKFELSPDNKIIKAMKIYGQDTVHALKSFDFKLDPTKYMGSMKLLRGIIEKDSLGNSISHYLEYYDEGTVGENANTDYWGYYNGEDDWFNYAPGNTYTGINSLDIIPCSNENEYTFQYSGRTKEPSIRARKNTLRKIYFPTKGFIEFEYEMNILKGSGSDGPGNGLRIKKIIENDNSGQARARTFKYTPYYNYSYILSGINDVATTTYFIGKYNIYSNDAENTGFGKYRVIDYSSNVPYRWLRLMDAYYSSVTEYIEDSNGNKSGRTEYNYEYNNHDFHIYDQLHPTGYKYVGPKYGLSAYTGWDNGLLVLRDVYDNKNILITSTSIDYNYIFSDTIQNTYVTQISYYSGEREDDSVRRERLLYQRNYLGGNYALFGLPSVYSYNNYDIITGWAQKTSEIETSYFNGSPLTKTTTYKYNDPNKYVNPGKYYPASITRTNSDNSLITIKVKYPYDIGIPPYTTMVKRNIISTPVVQEEFHNNDFLRADSTAFTSLWDSTIFKPLAHYTKNIAQTGYERRFNFNDYDYKGNILSLSKENDINYVYIWGYNQTYPVAEIKNATISQVNSLSPDISKLEAGNSSERLRIRVGLPSAQITFYTYKLLIGMTSQTDPNGVSIYYEYDSYGRLMHIKDDDSNIIKSYSYHYGLQEK